MLVGTGQLFFVSGQEPVLLYFFEKDNSPFFAFYDLLILPILAYFNASPTRNNIVRASTYTCSKVS
jgi:hypothetical protein